MTRALDMLLFPPLAMLALGLTDCGSSGSPSAQGGAAGQRGSEIAAGASFSTTQSDSVGWTISPGAGGAVGQGRASATGSSTTTTTSPGATTSTEPTIPATSLPSTTTTATSAGTDGGATDGGTTGPTLWVMGYFPTWKVPSNGGTYAVSAIDWDGLTHVAAAFYVPDTAGGWGTAVDATTASSLIAAAHAHGKNAIASIGGSGSGAVFEASTGSSNLATFVGNLESLLTLGFDGIDIDWEGGNLTTDQDQALQTSLIEALRTRSPHAVLTLTAGYLNENMVGDLSWYGTIAAQLDRINLMTYGMSGAWEGWESWHSSPLHWNQVASTPTGIDASVAHYLAAKVPAAKLGVGIGFFGECYTAPVTAPVQSLGASAVAAGDGTMSYTNILASYYSTGAYHYDSDAQVPYLTLTGTNPESCTFVTYEDPTSLAAKAAWIKGQGLGGAIIWEISEDYVASGATVQAQNPLLEVTKTAFLQ
jgi:chitinase